MYVNVWYGYNQLCQSMDKKMNNCTPGASYIKKCAIRKDKASISEWYGTPEDTVEE